MTTTTTTTVPAGLVESVSFTLLAAAGWPLLQVEIPGLGISRAVWLSTNLDGSVWVLFWHGADYCTPAEYTTPCDPHAVESVDMRPRNPLGLSSEEIEVLIGLRRADRWGMIDHDHEPAVPVEAAVRARRHLHSIGLVAERPGVLRLTPNKTRAQVWVITTAGEHALRDPRPPLNQLLSAARARRAS